MAFAEVIRRMTEAACRGDGAGVAACFTPDGVYHDVFYGEFRGADIARMIEQFFHRDAENFRWDIHDPVEGEAESGPIGYARYVFSFDSKMPGHEGNRACFEGVAVCRLKDGLIEHYGEVAEATAGLALMGFSDERIAKHSRRMGRYLLERDEAAGHRAG